MAGVGMRVRLEPYRLLFPLGYLFAVLGLGIWIEDYLAPKGGNPGEGHAVLMMQGFAFTFSLGILLTELPKSLGRIEPPPWTHLVLFVVLLLAMAASALEHAVALSQGFYLLAVLALTIYLLLTLILKREGPAHPDLVFTGASILSALAGAVVWLIAEVHALPGEVLRWAQLAGFQAYFLLFAFGTFHWETPAKPGAGLGRRAAANACAAAILFALITVEAFASSWFPDSESLILRLAHAGKAGLVLWFILRRVPRTGPAYRGAARYALWSIFLGFTLTVIIPGKNVALSHFTYIAGFCWLVLSRGAVLVSLRSSWQLPLAKKSSLAAYGLLLAAGGALRVLADFSASSRPVLLLLAAGFVLLPMLLWAVFAMPRPGRSDRPAGKRDPTG